MTSPQHDLSKLRIDRTAPAPRTTRLPLYIVGLVILAVAVAVLAPLLAPHNPDEPFKSRTLTTRGIPIGPEREFPLGADTLGRCEFSRLLYGGRVSLSVAFAATALLATVGTVVGMLAGYFGGRIDTALMRFVDILL